MWAVHPPNWCLEDQRLNYRKNMISPAVIIEMSNSHEKDYDGHNSFSKEPAATSFSSKQDNFSLEYQKETNTDSCRGRQHNFQAEEATATTSMVSMPAKTENIQKVLLMPPLPHSVATMRVKSFPVKMYELVQYTNSMPFHSNFKLLSWHPRSNSSPNPATEYNHKFVIWNKEEFMKQLGPQFFPTQSSFRSLERTLNSWGFVRDATEESLLFQHRTRPLDQKSLRVFSNPLFQRHDHFQVMQIQRRKQRMAKETSHMAVASAASPWSRPQLLSLLPNPTPAITTAPASTPINAEEGAVKKFPQTSKVSTSRPTGVFGCVDRFLQPPDQRTSAAKAAGASSTSTSFKTQLRSRTTLPLQRMANLKRLSESPTPPLLSKRFRSVNPAPSQLLTGAGQVVLEGLGSLLQKSLSTSSLSSKHFFAVEPASSPWVRGAGQAVPEGLGSLLQQSYDGPPKLSRRESQFADAVDDEDTMPWVPEKSYHGERDTWDQEVKSNDDTESEDELVF
ncbi:HSF-type DNA-binding protein [Nitzschia inconspicua]|uniref:HSF-type DNA-binding protein n=1 Tax=Nitzschia inconspicua TaxID=303405 RepID=A0A9K3L3E5_9STRA|nr:HSF-type DNA-binding protein [Nitzschia inconspicua]